MIRVLPINSMTENGVSVLNVTSRSKLWTRAFSPFLLGPVRVGDMEARNVENAWQFSKVYPEHDFMGQPTSAWYEWRRRGFDDVRAHRYPMGKGKKPLYSWHPSVGRLTYIEARRKIYIPLYRDAALRCPSWLRLWDLHKNSGQITLLDFDAYDHYSLGYSWKQVVEDSSRKMGHAFVLAMILENADFGETYV